MGAQAAVLDPASPHVNLAADVALMEDLTGRLTRQDMDRPEVAALLKPWQADRGDPNLGFSTSAWWVRVRLQRTADAPRTWILDIPYGYNKYLDFYAPGVPPVLTGHARPVDSRPIFSRHFAFPVTVTETAQDYFLRVKSHYAISLPLELWQPSAYAEHTLTVLLLECLYYGALLALVVYNAFLCVSLRDARFGHYALLGLFLNAGMFAANGLGRIYLWPDFHAFDEVSSGLFFGLAGAFFVAFGRSFLQTRLAWPLMDRVLWVFGLLYAGTAVLFVALMGQTVWVSEVFQVMLALSPVSVAALCFAMLRTRIWQRPGVGCFALAWSCLALGMLVAVLRAFDWVPTNAATSYALQIGSALEMVLFSFALAAVVRDERQQRMQAQAATLTAKEEMIALLREGEQRLEAAVKERTHDLDLALRREQGMLAQYLRFAALVSHEFRNRLNVISSQADMLCKDVPQPATHSRTQVIRRSVNHLASLTDRWLEGDRLFHSEIQASASDVVLLPWLQSLLEKSPQYKETHHVSLDEVPATARLHADLDLLEIAVGNLIGNACKYTPPGGWIRVSVLRQTGMTGIAVQDNGPGIAAADQAQLFEPYVRLSPEGPVSGTGLGLNFVRRIAEAHGGQVTLDSAPGRGSKFVIWFVGKKDE